jgi:hypothetical protein
MNNFSLENFVKLSFYRYKNCRDLRKKKEYLRWNYKGGVFAFVNNATGRIYIGSSHSMGSTIKHHLKSKINNILYPDIKQVDNFSFYILELLFALPPESYMKGRRYFYIKQIPFEKRYNKE